MSDHPLSKSEIFFYGALSQRLSPLIKDLERETKGTSRIEAEERLAEWFPTYREIYPKTVEPFAAIEQLAIELGLAQRVELEPAGDDAQSPLNPEVHTPPLEDTEWVFADGRALQGGEFDHVMAQLARGVDEAFAGAGDEVDEAFLQRVMARAGGLIDSLSGVPQWLPMTPRQAFFKELTAIMGPFVVEGYSPSSPGFVYRVSWRGDLYRYRVPTQENRFYLSLLERFDDELEIPSLVRWSLGQLAPTPMRSPSAPIADTKPKASRLALWMKHLQETLGTEDEWLLANQLAYAQSVSRLLESRIVKDEKAIGAVAAGESGARKMTTRDRLDEFIAYLPLNLDERVKALKDGERNFDVPEPTERLVGGLRFLCDGVSKAMGSAAEIAYSAGLHEVVALAQGGANFAKWFDYEIKSIPAGLTAMDELRRGSRQLSDVASDAMNLAYGQLYFRELTDELIYIDPATQLKLLREPKAVREQLAEAIRQYERQTLPNCSVTSACGLVEPTVRKMAAAWLQPGTYRGDTAAVLRTLLESTLAELNHIRGKSSADGNPSPEEADALLRLFCINVAFGLNHLGNTVRHHASKTLKRHDAGVMLHGLCAILQRL
jgi:hypothetical protein